MIQDPETAPMFQFSAETFESDFNVANLRKRVEYIGWVKKSIRV